MEARKILRQKKRQTRLVAIIFAISPFVSGNGAIDPLTTGGGSGGDGGGGMLHGGEMVLVDLGWEEVMEDPEVLDLSHPYPIDLNGSVATMSNVDLEKTIRSTSAPVQQVRRYGT